MADQSRQNSQGVEVTEQTGTELTKEEMEDIFLDHEIAELEGDLDAVMATVAPNPHFELPTLGLALDGRDAVRRYYQLTLDSGERDGRSIGSSSGGGRAGIAARKRQHSVARNTLCREAIASFTRGGKRISGVYNITVSFDPDLRKIYGERMYFDTVLAALFAEAVGDDFATYPGVQKLSDYLPNIEEHDAYEHAAARGTPIRL